MILNLVNEYLTIIYLKLNLSSETLKKIIFSRINVSWCTAYLLFVKVTHILKETKTVLTNSSNKPSNSRYLSVWKLSQYFRQMFTSIMLLRSFNLFISAKSRDSIIVSVLKTEEQQKQQPINQNGFVF